MDKPLPTKPSPPLVAKVLWLAELVKLSVATLTGAFAFPLLENFAADQGWLGSKEDRFGWLIAVLTNPWVSALITASLALLSGLFLGSKLFKAYREGVPDNRTRIRNRDDLEYLGLPVLGSTPHIPLKDVASELNDHRSGLGESYALIAAQLQRWTAGADTGSVIQVTSLRPADGKSTTALGLAASLGRIGKAVLLIDGDLRNPSLHRSAKRNREPGLTSTSVAKAIQTQVLPGVDFIPAGASVLDPVSVMARTLDEAQLAAYRRKYDFVVVDSPPGFFGENARLSGLADRVLLVVRHNTVLYLVRSFAAFLSFESDTRIATVLTHRLTARGNRRADVVYSYDYAYDYTYGAENAASLEVDRRTRAASYWRGYYRQPRPDRAPRTPPRLPE